MGARVRVEGEAAGPHTLLIANHVSWLDIIALGGATGCAFVSKDQLGHGFIHWLADQNRTVYVRRAQRSAGLATTTHPSLSFWNGRRPKSGPESARSLARRTVTRY